MATTHGIKMNSEQVSQNLFFRKPHTTGPSHEQKNTGRVAMDIFQMNHKHRVIKYTAAVQDTIPAAVLSFKKT